MEPKKRTKTKKCIIIGSLFFCFLVKAVVLCTTEHYLFPRRLFMLAKTYLHFLRFSGKLEFPIPGVVWLMDIGPDAEHAKYSNRLNWVLEKKKKKYFSRANKHSKVAVAQWLSLCKHELAQHLQQIHCCNLPKIICIYANYFIESSSWDRKISAPLETLGQKEGRLHRCSQTFNLYPLWSD